MKKIVVLATALALFATPLFAATIVGTKHDLSSLAATVYSGTASTEVCVYCHTPHGADTAISIAPLWNRSTVAATGVVYTGLDLNTTTTVAEMSITSINATDAPLCLSCHSTGAVATDLLNPPNSGDSIGAGDTAANITGDADLTTDLSDDHPIAFSYDANDAELQPLSAVSGTLTFFTGTVANELWCSTCHDVHDNTNAPFLRVSNASSGLCTTCHIK